MRVIGYLYNNTIELDDSDKRQDRILERDHYSNIRIVPFIEPDPAISALKE